MIIYFLLAFLIILCPIFFKAGSVRSKKWCCYFIFFSMLCVMGFRSESLGMYDVEYVYLPMVRNVQNLSFSGVFTRYPFQRGNLLQILTKIYTLFSTNENLWIFLTSIPFLAALTHLVRKYGIHKSACAFSFFLILGLRIYGTNFYLIRHSIAMAVLIYAFDCVIEKKRLKFVLLVLLASLFHTVSIVFLITYPLARIKVSAKQLLLISAGFVWITYFASSVMNHFFSLLNSDNYYYNYASKRGFASNIFIPVCIILFLIAYVICKRNKIQISENDSDNIINEVSVITVNMLCITSLFMGMSTVISEFQRIAFFFLSVSTVGLSNIIYSETSI